MVWFKRITVLLVIVLAGVGIAVGLFFNALNPVKPDAPQFLYYIAPGTSLQRITEELQKKSIIRNADALQLYARLRNWHNQIKTGYFEISAALSGPDILQKFVKGETKNITYTIPEGYRIDQAAKKLVEFRLSPQTYIELAQTPSRELLNTFGFLKTTPPLTTLEGFLFPDTYYLTSSEADLIASQLRRFEEVVMPLWQKRPDTHALNFVDTIKLASIVELEGLLDRELPVIAGVFLERLRIGMTLGSDPTVEYALGWHQGAKGLSFKDVQIDSPYNTYKYKGLPPTPIGNPGVAAIKAVLNPQKTPYLYFVAKGNGEHIFSKTYQEHLAAIKRIKSGNI